MNNLLPKDIIYIIRNNNVNELSYADYLTEFATDSISTANGATLPKISLTETQFSFNISSRVRKYETTLSTVMVSVYKIQSLCQSSLTYSDIGYYETIEEAEQVYYNKLGENLCGKNAPLIYPSTLKAFEAIEYTGVTQAI